MSADRRRIPLRALLAIAVALVGLKVVQTGIEAISGPPGPSSSLLGGWSGPVGAPLPPSIPLRVRVPSVGIDAPLVRLGENRAGAVDVPPMDIPTEAGWFTGAPTPGQRGAAIIVGHVDTDRGRAVFYPLGNIQPGASIFVDRTDRHRAEFRVTSVEVVDKEIFPADRVYGSTDQPELRLITCGGAFDGQHYSDNLVVYAELVP